MNVLKAAAVLLAVIAVGSACGNEPADRATIPEVSGVASTLVTPSSDDAEWVLGRVGGDGRTLNLWVATDPCHPIEGATVDEEDDRVSITVQLDDLSSEGDCSDASDIDLHEAHLHDPLGDRQVAGSCTDQAVRTRMCDELVAHAEAEEATPPPSG